MLCNTLPGAGDYGRLEATEFHKAGLRDESISASMAVIKCSAEAVDAQSRRQAVAAIREQGEGHDTINRATEVITPAEPSAGRQESQAAQGKVSGGMN